MNIKKHTFFITLFLIFIFSNNISAQIPPNVYHFEEKSNDGVLQHELKMDGDYLIHTVYKKSPAEFLKTYGGYYTTPNNILTVALEFNSDYKTDNISSLKIPFKVHNGQLILDGPTQMTFDPSDHGAQDLDGKWLITGRKMGQGKEQMDTTRPRKTMKFLLNGHFQWIAFNTETFDFFGSGGGTYRATNGKYEEKIDYFSRDNSRVGATLSFNYELNGKDWLHTGKSSKGDPLNETWTKREQL